MQQDTWATTSTRSTIPISSKARQRHGRTLTRQEIVDDFEYPGLGRGGLLSFLPRLRTTRLQGPPIFWQLADGLGQGKLRNLLTIACKLQN